MLLTSGEGLGTLSHMASEGLALSQAQTLSSDVKTCMYDSGTTMICSLSL